MENDKMQGMIKFELKRSFKNKLFNFFANFISIGNMVFD